VWQHHKIERDPLFSPLPPSPSIHSSIHPSIDTRPSTCRPSVAARRTSRDQSHLVRTHGALSQGTLSLTTRSCHGVASCRARLLWRFPPSPSSSLLLRISLYTYFVCISGDLHRKLAAITLIAPSFSPSILVRKLFIAAALATASEYSAPFSQFFKLSR
jgi:hypothetical protein